MNLLYFLLYFIFFNLSVNAEAHLCSSLFESNTKVSSYHFLDNATFGAEFTFTSPRMLAETVDSGYPVRTDNHLRIRSYLEKRCGVRGDCVVLIGYDKHGGNFRVLYEDGWFFEVGIDRYVIEVQTIKSTYQQLKDNKPRIQRDLFDVMKEFKLEPHSSVGGGHIHVGAEPFHEDPVLFRNFFVDYANFPQVSDIVFSNKNPNSPPISSLQLSQKTGFVEGLKIFDAIEKPLLKDFIWQIHSKVYTQPYVPEWGGGANYQAIRIERMHWNNGTATFELRAFRPQKSIDEYLMQIELIGARMDYLKQKKERVSYLWSDVNPDLSRQGVVDAYYQYVTESGLSWKEYQKFLSGRLQSFRPKMLVF